MGFENTVTNLLRENPRDFMLVIVDENLDIDGNDDLKTVSGSRCVERLRKLLAPEEEVRLLSLIRSANDSKEDIELYKSRAHGFLLKGPAKKESVLETIAPWWMKRFGGCSTRVEDL